LCAWPERRSPARRATRRGPARSSPRLAPPRRSPARAPGFSCTRSRRARRNEPRRAVPRYPLAVTAEASWILLRIPGSPDATRMSGVLSIGGTLLTREGPDIPTVCDALAADAKAAGHELGTPSLIFPLDGRHGLAHVVLEEAQRRG